MSPQHRIRPQGLRPVSASPGSGKSTLVSLDGFHLTDSALRRLGRQGRKGAPDTFDAAGSMNLLWRLRKCEEAVVYASCFDRSMEASIAGAIAVPNEPPLVITEGNYLLLNGPEWVSVTSLLDTCWYVELGEKPPPRKTRLTAHRVRPNARDGLQTLSRFRSAHAPLIRATRWRASRVIQVRSHNTSGNEELSRAADRQSVKGERGND